MNFLFYDYQEMQESKEDNFESQQQKAIHSSHGSLYAATQAAKAASVRPHDGEHPLLVGVRELESCLLFH